MKYHIQDLGSGAFKAGCMKTLYEFNIFTIMRKHGGYLSANDICKEVTEVHVNSGYLHRILRFMVFQDHRGKV